MVAKNLILIGAGLIALYLFSKKESYHCFWEDVPICDFSSYNTLTRTITELIKNVDTDEDVSDQWSPQISEVWAAWIPSGETQGISIPVAIQSQIGVNQWVLEPFSFPVGATFRHIAFMLAISGIWQGQSAQATRGRTIFIDAPPAT